MSPDLANIIYRAMWQQQSGAPYLNALSGGINRGAPMTPPPTTPPANLGQIYSQAGPFMQQALSLGGSQRPVHSPPPQPGGNLPPSVGIRPPMPGEFLISPIELMSRQWLSALSGR